jgi:hypothetical protein
VRAATTAIFTKETATIQKVGEDPTLAHIEDAVGGREGVEAGFSAFIDERFDAGGERPGRLFVEGLRAKHRRKFPASTLHLLAAIFPNFLHFVEGREQLLLLGDRRPEACEGPAHASTGIAAAAMTTMPAVVAVAAVPALALALASASPLPAATTAATAAEHFDEADETDRTE